ncbi:helix-turn-helix domain-containing protein [Bacillus sp. FJAT-29937]|uniref:helix-turn-helix domain-containing protein n=1 Tax=Bacillus sp. FJAT-29937 TaxID=1720553 RepID=UPI00082BF091|nr:helix-turn-helix transcriptional regulator [Bacillus sp. FJAT-29937]
MDRIKLGLNIRKVRKEKNITLRDLATGLFSLGKMSNIENGITEITEKELLSICARLGVTKDELMPENERVFLNEIHSKISEIENCIFLNFFEHAKYLIKELENMTKEETTHFHLYYLRALLSHKMGEYKGVFLYLQKILNHTARNEVELSIQSKSLILAGVINYSLGDFNTALDMTLKASELIVDKAELNKIQYNLAVIQATKGNIAESKIIIEKMERLYISNDPKIKYLSALLEVLTGNYGEPIEKIYQLRSDFFKNNDYDTFIRSLLLFIYLHDIQVKKFDRYIGEIFNFLELYLNQLVKINDSEDLSILLSQALLNSALKRKDKEQAEILINYINTFINKYPKSASHSFSYYLKSKYVELFDPNQVEQERLIKMALESFPEESHSIYKGILFFELAQLGPNEDSESSYKRAAQEFYSSVLNKHFNPVQFKFLHPKLYITL